MIDEQRQQIVLSALREASEKWKEAFNSGNAAGCASQYEADAIMTAKPFGTFTGREEIQAFWQQLVERDTVTSGMDFYIR